MTDSFAEQVLRYYKAGKSNAWIANRLSCNLLEVSEVLNKKEGVQQALDKRREEKGKQEQAPIEDNFQEVPPVTKEVIEQELIVASSLMAEASRGVLAAVHALNNQQPTEKEFLEYLLDVHQANKANNPYEHLTDSILSDFIVIKRK